MLANHINFKTTIDSAALIRTIEDFFSLHAAIPTMVGQRPMCASRFEDWIDPRARPVQEKRLEQCLGLPPRVLKEDEVGIQERFPILETITNSEDVKRALQGTAFEYMLEDAALVPRPSTHASQVEYGFLDDASRDIVFDRLKASERFYAEGFEDASEWRAIAGRLHASLNFHEAVQLPRHLLARPCRMIQKRPDPQGGPPSRACLKVTTPTRRARAAMVRCLTVNAATHARTSCMHIG